MKEGGTGGANTKTGLQFEERTDLRQIFESIPGYQLKAAADRSVHEVWFDNELPAHCFKKREF